MYYNLELSKKILEDRKKEREKLNEILGDISPYWHCMEVDEESEDSLYEEENQEEESEIEENDENW